MAFGDSRAVDNDNLTKNQAYMPNLHVLNYMKAGNLMPCTVRHLFAMVWYPAAHIHCGKS
jgi:hypothetical protein